MGKEKQPFTIQLFFLCAVDYGVMFRLLFLLIIPLCSFELEPVSYKWIDHRQLSFEDFKGRVPASSLWAAVTSSSISFSHSTRNGFVTDCEVFASFEPQSSWMKEKNGNVLEHEQLHFDITELFARKFYQQLLNLAKLHQQTDTKAHFLFKQINNSCKLFQQQYDSETGHGTNLVKQNEWEKKIAEALSQTPSYLSD